MRGRGRGCDCCRLDGTLEIKDEGVRRGMEDMIVATLTAMLEWRKHNNKVPTLQLLCTGCFACLLSYFGRRLASDYLLLCGKASTTPGSSSGGRHLQD